MTATAVLAAKGLSKSYKKVLAVRDFEITLNRGEITGLVGPNGAGKTTLLGMLLNVIKPTAGRIILHDGVTRENISGIVGQAGIMPAISVRRTIRAWTRVTGAKTNVRDSLMEALGIDAIMKRPVGALSLGETQRLAIVLTLLREPDVIILDEPGNGLDPGALKEFREILRAQAAAGRSVLISSHQLSELEQVCTHIVLMNEGRIDASGTRESIMAEGRGVILTCDDTARFASALSELPGATITIRDDEIHVNGNFDGRDVIQFLSRQSLFPWR